MLPADDLERLAVPAACYAVTRPCHLRRLLLQIRLALAEPREVVQAGAVDEGAPGGGDVLRPAEPRLPRRRP
jgi:hypothetical protein